MRDSSLVVFIVFACLTSGGCIGSKTDAKAQDTVANGGERVEPDENLVTVVSDKDSILGKTFEEVIAGPAPKVILRVDCANGNATSAHCPEVSLSAEALQLIAEYWKPALGFQFFDVNGAYADAQTNYNVSMRHSNVSLLFRDKLQGTRINAPGGERLMSATEAGKILGSINQKAVDIIRERFVFPELDRRKSSIR